jgi:AcrR family transcriptional regulator
LKRRAKLGVDGKRIRRAPEEKRQRIIVAAKKTFARLGPAATRIEDVASKAKVNKQLVYHYFGSKEALFEAVIDAFVARSQAALDTLPKAWGERLSELFTNVHRDIEFTRLMTWEGLGNGGAKVSGEAARRAQWKAFVLSWGQRLPAAEAAQLTLSMLGAAVVARILPQFVRLISGRQSNDAAFVTERAAHLRRLGERMAAPPTHWGELRYLYTGTNDFEGDLRVYEDTLMAQRKWAFSRFGAKVAALEVGPGPLVLLADHRPAGEQRALFRVKSLEEISVALADSAVVISGRVETPVGPCLLCTTPGGQLIGFFEETRPDSMESAFVDVTNESALRP